MTAPKNPRRGHRLPPKAVVGDHAHLREGLERATEGLGVFASDDPRLPRDRETRIATIRRRGFTPDRDTIGTMTLVDEDGVLRWEANSVVSTFARGPRRRRRTGSERRGAVVEQYRFEQLEKSKVGEFLGTLDRRINEDLADDPARNLRALTPQLEVGEPVAPAPAGRILVLVHGTFSHSKNLVAALTATEIGKRLLGRARERYDQVLAFDHPTLQVSPVMNAVDLERALGSSRATVDLVCHSRGGLVARWWVEALARDPNRVGEVVLVGSPLAGTSLAAPPKLRRALDLMTNVFAVLAQGSTMATQVAPFMIAVTGLLRVLSSAGKALARTPLIDAAVAVVPGLVGMSRTGDNPEVLRLQRGTIPAHRYHAVVSDFEPDQVGWRFWRLFTRKPGQRVADLGADFLFDEANDLVVDTASMRDLVGTLGPAGGIADFVEFAPSDQVHHLNYFEQKRTLDLLEKTFRLDGA